MRNTLAWAAAIVAACSTLPYLVDIVKRRTKPNIVSWLTWTILTSIATAAAFAAGAPRSALLTLGSAICTAAVVVLGVYYGTAKFSRFDIVCQIGAFLGLALWLILKAPIWGIIIPVGIDFVAVLPTLRHSWLKPGEETWQTFIIGVIAASLTVVSLTDYSLAGLLYPAYLVIANGVIVLAVLGRRKHLGLGLWQGGEQKTLHEEAV